MYLPVLALLLAAVFGGLNGVFAKLVLTSFSPFSFSFVRYIIVLSILFPILFFQKRLKMNKKDLPLILFVSTFWAGNQFLFLFAVKSTTAIMSQVMYFFSPLIVLILSIIIFKQKFLFSQIMGILLGMVGGSILILSSYLNHSKLSLLSVGTLGGNILLFSAVICWSFYLFFSKKLTQKYPPLNVTTYSGIVPFFLSFLLTIPEIQAKTFPPSSVSLSSIIGLMGLVFGASIAMVFLYQWGIKKSSPFAASLMIYVSPISASIVSIPLLGEKITWPLFISTIIVAIGLYLAVIYPNIKKR